MRKRPLFISACVFLIGLTCYRYQRYEMVLVVLGLLCYEAFCFFKHKKKMVMVGRSVLLLSAFFIGLGHMATEMTFRDAYLSKIKDGQQVTIWGEVIKVEFGEKQNSIYLSDCYISLPEGTIPCNDVIVYASKNQFQIGEIHKITGKLQKFSKARNEGGFDRRTYYQSLKLDFAVMERESQFLGKQINWWESQVLVLRENIRKVYAQYASQQVAGFLSAMVLGDKSELDKDLKRAFTDGGLAHILAISGLHVSIIGRKVYNILRNRGISFVMAGIMAGLILISYCFMVGNGMSAIRATGMLVLFFVAQSLGRGSDLLNSLGAMVLVLLWDNPFYIEYSGFWFSIMSLLGVGYVGSIWGKFGMSVAISFTTLPLVAAGYYEIPLYSPLTNFLLLPLLTPIFVLAIFGGLLGVIVGTGGGWIVTLMLQPCEWGLQIYEWVCGVIQNLPFAQIITGVPNKEVILLYYGVLFLGTYALKSTLAKRKMPWKKKVGWGMTMMAICLALIVYPKPKPKEISFLDVGQGDGIYISAGNGMSCFVDGGSAFSDGLGEYTILPFLKSKGVRAIDYWFVSHGDKDHVSGLMQVLESDYPVKYLVLSQYAPRDEKMSELLSLAKKHHTEILWMKEGDRLQMGEMCVKCIYPGYLDVQKSPELLENRNEASLVLEIVFERFGEIKDFRALFAGDVSSEVEKMLLDSKGNSVPSSVWLYKASHHGSKYSNSKELLEKMQPQMVVISCSKTNTYGHPSPEVIDRIEQMEAEIYYTMFGGQITIREDGSGTIGVQEFLK